MEQEGFFLILPFNFINSRLNKNNGVFSKSWYNVRPFKTYECLFILLKKKLTCFVWSSLSMSSFDIFGVTTILRYASVSLSTQAWFSSSVISSKLIGFWGLYSSGIRPVSRDLHMSRQNGRKLSSGLINESEIQKETSIEMEPPF